jgi:hypothetical protein
MTDSDKTFIRRPPSAKHLQKPVQNHAALVQEGSASWQNDDALVQEGFDKLQKPVALVQEGPVI